MMIGRPIGTNDLRWMRAALALARRGLGNVWPNPAVGCVIVARWPRRRARLDPARRPAACRDRGLAPGRRRRAAPPPMSPSNRAAIGGRRRPAPTR